MSEIVGACLSQLHDDPDSFELLLAFSDGREFGHMVTRSAAQRIAAEFATEFPALTNTSGDDEALWAVAKALHEGMCSQDVNGYLDAKIDCARLAPLAVEAYLQAGGHVKQEPTARDALQAIAGLPTGKNEDVMNGQEDAYRAVEALFSSTPQIICTDEYQRGMRDGVREAIQIASDQAASMADLALDGLPENSRNREAMEAALTRFSHTLHATLDALARPQSAAVRDGWQPIDTAPKDGTEIIGWDGRRPFRCKMTKHYVKWPHEDGGPTFRDVWSGDCRDCIVPENPTHWMPLPAAPALHSTQEG